MIKVNIKNESGFDLPEYKTRMSSGLDLRAKIKDVLVLEPGNRALIPTGLYLDIPAGYEGQVRPRSGLAIKHGITVLNTPGTIDSDYRGEIKVILINLSDENFTILNGDRIAQIVFSPVEQIGWVNVSTVDETDRGTGGFGHTGLK